MDKDFLLISKMKNGDEPAMESFVRRYYPQILRYCYYHLADKSFAEDMAQETFEKFFTALPIYRHRGKALNYLYTIAGNLCRDLYKKRADIPFKEMPDTENYQLDPIDSRLDMEKALAGLSQESRDILILYFFQERKQREIAEILHIGLPLVKYRLKQAKQQLGGLLGKEDMAE